MVSFESAVAKSKNLGELSYTSTALLKSGNDPYRLENDCKCDEVEYSCPGCADEGGEG